MVVWPKGLSVKILLYPEPFGITIDARNTYLECESLQVESFVWYRWHQKNGQMLVDGNVVYKSNTHAGSYASKTVKAGTVAGHMMRIKSTCVFEADALWFCVCKLLELELSGCWKRRDLKRVLSRKVDKSSLSIDASFWNTLLKVYNLLDKI